jgi:hypothetical protein
MHDNRSAEPLRPCTCPMHMVYVLHSLLLEVAVCYLIAANIAAKLVSAMAACMHVTMIYPAPPYTDQARRRVGRSRSVTCDPTADAARHLLWYGRAERVTAGPHLTVRCTHRQA